MVDQVVSEVVGRVVVTVGVEVVGATPAVVALAVAVVVGALSMLA